jgi:PilZ domain.
VNLSNRSSGSEKRTQVRIPIDDEILVRDTVSGLELGTLANVHDAGFMVISDGGLKEDNLYQVAFEVNSGRPSITLGAECLWISETGTGDQVWAGFQIMDLSEDARQQIAQLMTQYQE